MKRDLDLIRKILQACEDHGHAYAPQGMAFEGHTEEEAGWHVYLAGEAGLLRVSNCTTLGSPSPRATPINITSEGYEFLEASRDEGRWNKAKDAAKSSGAFTLDVVKGIVIAMASAAARKAAGLP